MQGRPRGNASRVALAAVANTSASRGGGSTADTPRVKRVANVSKTEDTHEVARGRTEKDGAVDSIAARLDQWETQEEKRRQEQAIEG